MSFIYVLIPEFFIVWAIVVFTTIVRAVFHFFANKKIVKLLAKNGFIDVSVKIQNVIEKYGMTGSYVFTFRGLKEIYSSWSEFRRLEIDPQMRTLYRLQLFCKIERFVSLYLIFIVVGTFLRTFLRVFLM